MLSDDLAFADAIGKAYAVNNFSEGRFTLSKEGSDDVMLLRKNMRVEILEVLKGILVKIKTLL